MDKSHEKMIEWLNEKADTTLKIRKTEDGDEDVVELRLQAVDLVRHKDYDNYLSAHALLLNGAGIMKTDFGQEALPHDFFELSLTDSWSVDTTANTMLVHTERGTYMIETENRS